MNAITGSQLTAHADYVIGSELFLERNEELQYA